MLAPIPRRSALLTPAPSARQRTATARLNARLGCHQGTAQAMKQARIHLINRLQSLPRCTHGKALP